jgi:chromosome segregation ATPase
MSERKRSRKGLTEPVSEPVSDAHAQLQELSRRAADAESRAAQLEEELRKAREETASLQSRAQDAAALVARQAALEEEAALLRRRLDDATRTRDAALRQGEQDRVAREEALAALKPLEEERESLRKRAEPLAQELEKAARACDAALAKATSLEAEREEQRKRAEALSQDLEEAREHGSREALAKVSSLEAEREELRKRRDALSRNLEEAVRAREDALGQSKALAVELQLRKEEAANLGRQLEESRSEQQLLKEGLEGLKELRDRTLRENESLRAGSAGRLEALERELAAARPAAKLAESRQGEVERLEAVRREQERRIEALDRELAAARLSVKLAESRQGEVERLEAVRREQERRIADLERRLEEAGAPKPPPPSPAAVPQPQAETTLRSQHHFGPAAADGQPAYVLHEILGKDALGVVYRATERADGRVFAVRFLGGQAGEERTAAIEREVEKLIALPHPNILHVQGAGRRKNRLYLMMDYVEAPAISNAGLQELPKLCALLRDAALAVHYAHEERIYHGDLNPDNIRVLPDGQPLVKDFELAYLLERGEGQALRNPAFLPPEQIKSTKPLTAAVDVYGLGATLWTCVAGRPPFEGPDPAKVMARVLIEEPLPLGRVKPGTPEGLAAIVRRAMAKEPGLRYPAAKDFAEALGRFLEGGTAVRATPPAPGA